MRAGWTPCLHDIADGAPSMQPPPAESAPALPEATRARGRRLAIASHPFGMTFQTVFTQPLPTLALVALGASETLVGVQSALVQAFLLLQLPTLRLVARVPKRSILMGGHLFAVLAAAPLLGFAGLAAAPPSRGVGIALTCFGLAAAGISVANTVWSGSPCSAATWSPSASGGSSARCARAGT
jgi:hypothetical protein